MKLMLRLRLLVGLFMIAATATAQQSINADSLLLEAQQKARAGHYAESRTTARQVLQLAPGYTDATILIGNTYMWEQQYDSAKSVLEPLLLTAPAYSEVYLALARLSFQASATHEQTLAYAERGLALAPESQELKEYKAKALLALQRYDEAGQLLATVPVTDNRFADEKNMLEALTTLNSLRAEYQYTAFNQNTASWHLASLEYTRLAKTGSITARLNLANRFEQSAFQGEVDFWPHLNEKTYLYLNAGYSDSNLFPDFRAGLEVYRKLPQSMEASLGARLLVYDNQTVWLYTGHLGKYIGKYWLAFRPFVQYQQNEAQATGILQVRRYLKSSDEHLTLSLSKGSTPAIQVGLQEISRLDASRIGLEGRFRLHKDFYGGALLQYEYEEFAKDSFRSRYTTGLSLQYKFK